MASPKGAPLPTGTDDPDVVGDLAAYATNVDGRLARAMVVGSVAVASTASSTASTVVTFPAGVFGATIPRVLVTGEGSGQLVCYSTAISATGFTVAWRQVANSPVTLSIPVHYLAVVFP